ncbi:MAG: 2-oxoacid:ferredoxin oxidoreductase subunit beta [Candidatus Aminicenantes bacterium]|nr:2-oxoacid:ferredoxin oxidoreductase subunit beta [Candidatus Aminicenantes bacterium]MBM3311277.1 2-oxoacid:ferredoxin oxidoreductase subunit beta [Candidatus Aminicenantes bacterium]
MSRDAERPEPTNPIDEFLRKDRIPHIWCSGCGIGVVVSSFADALRKSNLDLNKVAIVSGIGCTGRVAGYVKLDSFHSTHGRPIPFATGLKLANPDLKVVVFSGDGDIFGIGGNHFIHAARRNMDMVVICVNNFNYAMTGGQVAATTPIDANLSTAPFGNFEHPFSLPYLADACGASYVARWTCLHIRRVTQSMQEALSRKGFSLIEVIAPCVTLYARRNRLGDGLNLLKYYYDNSVIQHGADTRTIEISYQSKMVCGKFVDREKPTFLESMNTHMKKSLGDKYVPYGE